jgi:hypothetical protein
MSMSYDDDVSCDEVSIDIPMSPIDSPVDRETLHTHTHTHTHAHAHTTSTDSSAHSSASVSRSSSFRDNLAARFSFSFSRSETKSDIPTTEGKHHEGVVDTTSGFQDVEDQEKAIRKREKADKRALKALKLKKRQAKLLKRMCHAPSCEDRRLKGKKYCLEHSDSHRMANPNSRRMHNVY